MSKYVTKTKVSAFSLFSKFKIKTNKLFFVQMQIQLLRIAFLVSASLMVFVVEVITGYKEETPNKIPLLKHQ